jgi:cytochrome c-type biogenesis protein CcmH/NrfF
VALDAGQTRQQILDAYVAQYGTRILIQPPAKGFNATLYVLPVVALVFSAGGVAWMVRRFLHRPAPVDADVPSAGPAGAAPDAALESRLDDELQELD